VQSFNCSRSACIRKRFPRPGGHQRNGWPAGRFAASLNKPSLSNRLHYVKVSRKPVMSQSDIEVSASEPGRSRFGTEASPELVTSQPDIEASRSETDTSHFDIGVSQPVAPISQSAGVALWP